jgi:hypothetical protein
LSKNFTEDSASCSKLNTGNGVCQSCGHGSESLWLRIFGVTGTLTQNVIGWPRKIGIVSKESGVFSVA